MLILLSTHTDRTLKENKSSVGKQDVGIGGHVITL